MAYSTCICTMLLQYICTCISLMCTILYLYLYLCVQYCILYFFSTVYLYTVLCVLVFVRYLHLYLYFYLRYCVCVLVYLYLYYFMAYSTCICVLVYMWVAWGFFRGLYSVHCALCIWICCKIWSEEKTISVKSRQENRQESELFYEAWIVQGPDQLYEAKYLNFQFSRWRN